MPSTPNKQTSNYHRESTILYLNLNIQYHCQINPTFSQ